MSNKAAYLGEFKHLLSILRLASQNNREYIAFHKNAFKNTEILNQLKSLGLIENFQNRGSILIVSFKQTYWKSFIFPMHSFAEIEHVDGRLRKHRSAKNISKRQMRLGHYVLNSMTTNAGVITGQEASFLKIGGLPLFSAH